MRRNKEGFQGGRPTASSLEIHLPRVCHFFWGGCVFSGRGFHFLFLFFLREKASYTRYHEVLFRCELTHLHSSGSFVVSPPLSGFTCKVDVAFLNATWLQS